MTTLKFAPFSSSADVTYFVELAHLKLNIWGLDSSAVPLMASFGPARQGASPRLSVARESLHPAAIIRSSALAVCACPGVLLNTNTTADFKALDKKAALEAAAAEVRSAVASGRAAAEPALLTRFVLLSFADLKAHQFIYWFGIPALTGGESGAETATVVRQAPFVAVFGPRARSSIATGLSALRLASAARGEPHCPPFFLVIASATAEEIEPAAEASAQAQGQAQTQAPGFAEAGGAARVLPLAAWNTLDAAEKARAHFFMIDPSGVPGIPGWPLRNFLRLLTDW